MDLEVIESLSRLGLYKYPKPGMFWPLVHCLLLHAQYHNVHSSQTHYPILSLLDSEYSISIQYPNKAYNRYLPSRIALVNSLQES